MSRKIKKKSNHRRLMELQIWFFLGIAGFNLWLSNIAREKAGWFDDGTVIFWNNISYVIFFALLTGFVIAKVLGKVSNTPKRSL